MDNLLTRCPLCSVSFDEIIMCNNMCGTYTCPSCHHDFYRRNSKWVDSHNPRCGREVEIETANIFEPDLPE